MTGTIAEICCGSYYDAKQAALGGAGRIELNSALMLGGLTPTETTLHMIKEEFPSLKVVAMVRPRGAGFCYSEDEFRVMQKECERLLRSGADGIAFGCLQADAALDEKKNRKLTGMIREMGKEAVFHRAFDCSRDPFGTMEQLISMGVTRVLTSGLKPKAAEGREMLKRLQADYGTKIQILAGSGVHAGNAAELMEYTGIRQVHSSCKAWKTDPTTVQNGISYSIADGERIFEYDVVSSELVRKLVDSVRRFPDRTEKRIG